MSPDILSLKLLIDPRNKYSTFLVETFWLGVNFDCILDYRHFVVHVCRGDYILGYPYAECIGLHSVSMIKDVSTNLSAQGIVPYEHRERRTCGDVH